MHLTWTGPPARRRLAGSLLCALAVALATAGHVIGPVAVSFAATSQPAPMPTARTSPGAALASNGQIYVVGGSSDVAGPLTTHESYDPAANTWTSRAPLPVRETGASVIGAANGLVYVIGGGFSNSSNNVFSYDPLTDIWTQRASIPASVGGGGPGPGMGASMIGSKIYVAGGYSSRRLRIYDTATDSWTAGADMLQARQSFALVAAANGKLYAFGGDNGQGTSHTSTEMYDPVTNTWAPRASMSQVRWPVAGALGSDGRIYAIGPGASAEAYDPAADRWEIIPSPALARQNAAVVPTADGRIVVIGGDSGYHASTSAVEIYSPQSGTWSPGASAPRITSFTINGQARSTADTAVTLAITATGGEGGVTEMSFSNDGTMWSEWRPYQQSASWSLTPGEAFKQVWARVRDGGGGMSAVASDTIWLDLSVAVVLLDINDRAPVAASRDVSLHFQALDDASGITGMSFSNDGAHWSDWEPYQPRKSWMLEDGPGQTRRVYGRARDGLGNIGIAYDDIELDAVPPTGSVTVPATASASGLHAASPTRQIQLTATDNLTPQHQIQMRLSNRPDFAGAIWKPFASSTSWDFTGGATVYAQFKDGAGNVSQTYSQSIAGGPSGGTSPAPNCSPRPRISVQIEPAILPAVYPPEPGAILVTVFTTGSNNGLRAVRFDSFSNAKVSVGSQNNQTAPFAVSIPPGQEPTSLQFVVQRLTNGQSTTVRLSVIDGCGEWSTFVGGGPNAF